MKRNGHLTVTPAAGMDRLRYWIPVIAYAGLIFYLSSQSRPSPPTLWLLIHLGDKTLHAIEYAVLGVLCYRAFYYATCDRTARSALMLAIITSIGYGVTDEMHQAFVPQRHPNGWDLLADAVGATVAATCWYWLKVCDKPGPACV